MPSVSRWTFMAALMASFALATLCAGGCMPTAGIKAGGKTALTHDCVPVRGKNVLFQSQQLSDAIDIIDMKSSMEGELLKIQASVRISPRAKDPDMLPFMYRFQWLDAQGKELAANPAPWSPILLFGRDTANLQGVAPAPGAREFRLLLMGADDSHC